MTATENGAFLVENHTKVTWKVDRRAVFDTKVQQHDGNGRSNDVSFQNQTSLSRISWRRTFSSLEPYLRQISLDLELINKTRRRSVGNYIFSSYPIDPPSKLATASGSSYSQKNWGAVEPGQQCSRPPK